MQNYTETTFWVNRLPLKIFDYLYDCAASRYISGVPIIIFQESALTFHKYTYTVNIVQILSPYHANIQFLYSLKTLENQRFQIFLRGIGMKHLYEIGEPIKSQSSCHIETSWLVSQPISVFLLMQYFMVVSFKGLLIMVNFLTSKYRTGNILANALLGWNKTLTKYCMCYIHFKIVTLLQFIKIYFIKIILKIKLITHE